MGKFRFFQCIWYTCCSDEFGRIYRSSTDSENHVLEAHLIKFVETPMDSTGFLFFFFHAYVVVCASRRHHDILVDDEIGRVYRSSTDSDRE